MRANLPYRPREVGRDLRAPTLGDVINATRQTRLRRSGRKVRVILAPASWTGSSAYIKLYRVSFARVVIKNVQQSVCCAEMEDRDLGKETRLAQVSMLFPRFLSVRITVGFRNERFGAPETCLRPASDDRNSRQNEIIPFIILRSA